MKAISVRSPFWFVAILFALAFVSFPAEANAGTWSGIEPLKSRRADVLQILGKPVSESADGPMIFKVAGGTVSVSFVDEKFVRSKKLRPAIAGTVLQIILQHETSSDSPDSLALPANRNFVSEQTNEVTVFRNLKEGVVYTFFGGKLRTTRYTFSESQISHARR
jgi:hypothetical protein